MRFGSLFSGIGGFDLGFERFGLVCEWQSEVDAKCQMLLANKFPSSVQLGDVKNVVRANVAPVDVLCGGFPCQDVSVAGRRAGLAGGRSGLWFEFARIIEELNPRIVCIENVPGLLSSNGGRDMAAVVGALGELGYGWAYRVLDAQYFGVAQRRRRVFIVGCLGNVRRAAEILFERESLPWDSPPIRGSQSGVTGTIEAGAGRRRGGGQNPSQLVSRCLTTGSDGGSRFDADTETFVVATLNSGGNSGGFRSEPGEHLVANTLRAEGHDASEDGAGRGTPLVVGGFKRGQGHSDRSDGYRLEQSPTLTSSDSGTQQSPGVHIGRSVRRLTPIECERLQGFPDNWTAGFADSTRYRMLGNAVAVSVAEWIGKRIVRAHQ